MKRTNGTLAAPLRGLRFRRLAATSLAAAPILLGAWLFTAALPALADGGPHVADVNAGVSTLTADSCAGCHRAHTAQGRMLINAANEEALCFTCHSTTGTGATTDVVSGVQYKAPLTAQATAPFTRTGSVLGALRSGGFVQARIGSSTPARIFRYGSAAGVWGKVSVSATSGDVTSAHLNLTENGLAAPTVAWGNGAISATANAGPTVSMTCATCHNPHGNGQYRILRPVPDPDATAGVFVPVAAPGASVTDAALPTAGDARNYTVIQVPGPSFLLTASQVASPETAGDYWHLHVPWNSDGGNPDAPNGIPYDTVTASAFETEMTAWCSACHTRYYSTSAGRPTADAIFKYRHQTIDAACTTCHVAHGSNAQMPGSTALGTGFSANFPYPAAPGAATTRSGSSRLLKVDNRGTCQMCHDPTFTETNNQYRGPAPTPGVP